MSEQPETWEEMAARVAGEVAAVVNLTYATTLAASMNSYLQVGFSHEHAFALTLAEHQSRLEVITANAVITQVEGDGEGA